MIRLDVCCGFAFGILYAPAQAIFFGYDLKQTMAWIIAGLPWDVVQGIGNLCAGLLIVPLTALVRKLLAKTMHMYY